MKSETDNEQVLSNCETPTSISLKKKSLFPDKTSLKINCTILTIKWQSIRNQYSVSGLYNQAELSGEFASAT